MESLPIVTLDTTLAELYKIGQNGKVLPKIGLLSCGWSSGMDLGLQNIPRNKRFQFHEPMTTNKREEDFANVPKDKLREIQAKIFAMVSQRDCIGAGDMASIFFTFDAADSEVPHSVSELRDTYSRLAPHQRPQEIYCAGPKDLPKVMQDHSIDVLALKCPIDYAEALPQVLDMGRWNYLNSKVAIHESGLPTPKTEVFEPSFCGVEPQDCCQICASRLSSQEISSACSGKRLSWLRVEVDAALSAVRARALPFVIKCQQSVGGGGAWILTSETEREKFLGEAESIIFPKVFAAYTALNRDLRPAALVFMDYVDNIVQNWGLTFFITRTGKPIFLSASEQKLREGKYWYGSEINYRQQDKLQEKFASLMEKITDFAYHRQQESGRYYGPIGADILEVAPANGGPPCDDQYLIVDLNVRIPGSLLLGFLKSHFMSPTSRPDGPLVFATNQFLEISLDRKTFIERFRHEFYVTKAIIISAWYWDTKAQKSHAALVVAGRTEEELEALTLRMNEIAQVFSLD